MSLKSLAERIILESIEDLWSEGDFQDSVAFFREEGFGVCAEIAGMNLYDQVRLLNLVNEIIDRKRIYAFSPRKVLKPRHAMQH
ncbi:MAG: hypothetical protein AB1632_10445 [Nitrospirota bacterium]